MTKMKDTFDYIKGIRGGWVINPRTRVFGYRMVQRHMFTESPEVKEEQVKRLQKIYEMRDCK